MKRKLKKSLSIILAALMLICSAPLADLTDFNLPDFGALFAPKAEAIETYTEYTEGHYTYWLQETTLVLRTVDTAISGDITIPSTLGGYPVSEIGDRAFINREDITSVIIPDTVKTIGDRAFFGCINMTSITIPDSVTHIKAWAFYDCRSITSLTIPDSVKTISDSAFAGIGITSLTIPDSVTTIGSSFIACTELETLKIGKGITKLDGFAGCSSLKTVIIPETVKSIDWMAFYDCSDIENVYYAGSESEWKQIAIDDDNEDLTSAKIHFNSSGPVGGLTNNIDAPEIPDYNSSVVDSSTVKTPSTSTINYGDSIVLHVDPAKIPAGGYVEWYSSNGNFSGFVSTNGASCTISPSKSGKTTFTALIFDEEGNIVSADTQEMTSKAGFFQKIIAFFKGLFGLNKTIPNIFKF